VCEREAVHTEFRSGNLREKDYLEKPGVDVRTKLRWIFGK